VRCSIAVAAVAAAGCQPTERCAAAADCASGFCRADGTCGPAGDADADAGPSPDAGPTAACTPDHDGAISAAELPLVVGRRSSFRVALDAAVDSAGVPQDDDDALRRWELAAAQPGDDDVELELVDPVGAWWAESFPDATHAVRLSAELDLLGVFRRDRDALRLLGVVSPDAGLLRTELAYDPPVEILPLPLDAAAAWTVETTVSGLAEGVVVLYAERYESAVDAVGEVVTPYGSFPVLRAATDLTRTVGVVASTRRSFAFVAECYGAVATIAGQDGDAGDDGELTEAAELWRLEP
jgi:hypothetical protein